MKKENIMYKTPEWILDEDFVLNNDMRRSNCILCKYSKDGHCRNSDFICSYRTLGDFYY